jgi:hypothetical protein
LNDGHFAHALHADRPTGRQVSWKILHLIVRALWPCGFDVQLIDKPGATLAHFTDGFQVSCSERVPDPDWK